MKPGMAFRLILITVGLVGLQSGCSLFHSARRSQSGQRFYAVRTESAGFYFHSPRTGLGPDKIIPKDTLVTVVRSSFGLSKVRLVSGENGYVKSDDIAPASPALVNPMETQPSATLANSSAWRAEIPQPRMDLPEAPLPEFEPTPLPEPVGLSH